MKKYVFFVCLIMLGVFSNSAYSQSTILDGMYGCQRATNGRAYCRRKGSESLQAVTEEFFIRYQIASGITPIPSPTVVVKPAVVLLAVDELSAFDGAWVSTTPPNVGGRIIFTRLSLGTREVSLPVLGQASIRISDGRDNSNFKVSGVGFNCYYSVSFLRGNSLMTWDLKSGDSVCALSSVYDKIQ